MNDIEDYAECCAFKICVYHHTKYDQDDIENMIDSTKRVNQYNVDNQEGPSDWGVNNRLLFAFNDRQKNRIKEIKDYLKKNKIRDRRFVRLVAPFKNLKSGNRVELWMLEYYEQKPKKKPAARSVKSST